MRTPVTLDNDLLDAAADYAGIKEKSALINITLKALVEREAARRLARLGGTMRDFETVPRERYFDPE